LANEDNGCVAEKTGAEDIYTKAAKCGREIGKWKINRMSEEKMWYK